jgi:drug/metabolite transporter (DMT)-like permease
MRRQTVLLTLLALSAFAANSVLCRLALKSEVIDAVTFTQIRLLAGAMFLAPFFYVRRAALLPLRASGWYAAAALFIYAVAFSLSYVSLDTGVGALILFGTVQFTMIGAGLVKGDHPGRVQIIGAVLAFAGLVYLLAPGLTAPPLLGAGVMGLAGVAWGAYSLFGKNEVDPVGATARNFAFAALAAIFLTLVPHEGHTELLGIVLAIASGAIASGAGYVIWYKALKGLPTMSASVVQLAVPMIAAFGGAVFIGEAVTIRLVGASALILGGIFVAIRAQATMR